ncbi:hypothetical protein V6N13_107028 [Hibiscus sabdariffa]
MAGSGEHPTGVGTVTNQVGFDRTDAQSSDQVVVPRTDDGRWPKTGEKREAVVRVSHRTFKRLHTADDGSIPRVTGGAVIETWRWSS